MRTDIILAAVLLAVCAVEAATAQPVDNQPPPPNDAIVEKIAECLSRGKETVVAPAIDCVDRGKGAGIAERAGMPLAIADPQGLCAAHDPRVLSGQVIKQLAAQTKYRIAPSGIRVVGAVYCDSLDLVGLDVPFSIALDQSLFLEGVNARNLRVRGDFSIDSGASLKSVLLNRARIDGSVYAQSAFIFRFISSDTNVAGSFHLNESLVLRDLQFFRANLSGDLSVSTSAFGSFLLQSSRIGGILELNQSEARCGYFIKANDLGYVMAVNAGFGSYRTVSNGSASAQSVWWHRSLGNKSIKSAFDAPVVQTALAAEIGRIVADTDKNVISGCGETTAGRLAGFYFFDNRVQTTLCLRAFQWLGFETGTLPNESLPVSILSLNGSRINNNLIINLWPPNRDDADRTEEDKHKLESVGVTAGALILNFEDNAKPYFTFLDNLTFERLHRARLTCEYQREGEDRAAVGEIGEVTLPGVDEVLEWLDKNRARSSQPFTAFTAAFERAGASAIPLRVRHNNKDLAQRWENWLADWLNMSIQPPKQSATAPSGRGPATVESGVPTDRLGAVWQPIATVLWRLIEFIGIAFQFAMWLLADYGLRPGKVVGWVAVVLLAFSLWFRFRLSIVGFEPKTESTPPKPVSDSTAKEGQAVPPAPPVIWPLSYLFLFDRLIPAYQIRKEHYAIANFYRRVPAGELATKSARPADWLQLPGQRKPCVVRPASEAERHHVERLLLALRLLGLVLSIFLLAAINSLVSK
jgi:hypothetical protein